MLVLGIETSCDETGVALYDSDGGIVGQDLFSQIDLHQVFGGVVPELASRDHLRRLLPLIQSVCHQAGVNKNDISAIAYTAGPGLVGALFVGASLARGLAQAWSVPTVGIHHMEGHLLAPFLAPAQTISGLDYPFLALLVSGGHTQIIEAQAPGCYRLLGDTLDDAVGEAFDKVASMLHLPYPGGPALESLAASVDQSNYVFPRPMVDRPNLDFSFSGLKTHVHQFIMRLQQDNQLTEQARAKVAKSFQEAVVDCLWKKCERALNETQSNKLVVAGGVSANQYLQAVFNEKAQKIGASVYFPPLSYCTDNGAMIAYAGFLRFKAGQTDASQSVSVRARWPLDELKPM